jgi:RimJ/RimL family protein N-acetyltransferase
VVWVDDKTAATRNLRHNRFVSHVFTASVPLLQTPRLTLREYRLEDFDTFAQHLGDPESAAHIGLADRPTAWRIFCSHAGLWLLHGAGWWAVELRQTRQLVGNVGAFFREASSVMEIGWSTYRAFWRQGFASEAAASALAHVLDVRREPKVTALIAPGNEPSLRVARRLGLTYETEVEHFGKTVGSYALERERRP